MELVPQHTHEPTPNQFTGVEARVCVECNRLMTVTVSGGSVAYGCDWCNLRTAMVVADMDAMAKHERVEALEKALEEIIEEADTQICLATDTICNIARAALNREGE